jgi:hypothetical protein
MGHKTVLEHNCAKNGCYLETMKLRLDDLVTESNLHSKSSFTDIDGMTERNSNFLMIEWKTRTLDFSRGQFLAYHRAAVSRRFVTLCLSGDPTTRPTTVTHMGWITHPDFTPPGFAPVVPQKGKDWAFTGWQRADLGLAQDAIGAWSRWAGDHEGNVITNLGKANLRLQTQLAGAESQLADTEAQLTACREKLAAVRLFMATLKP